VFREYTPVEVAALLQQAAEVEEREHIEYAKARALQIFAAAEAPLASQPQPRMTIVNTRARCCDNHMAPNCGTVMVVACVICMCSGTPHPEMRAVRLCCRAEWSEQCRDAFVNQYANRLTYVPAGELFEPEAVPAARS
jgi:hypothetical protein